MAGSTRAHFLQLPPTVSSRGHGQRAEGNRRARPRQRQSIGDEIHRQKGDQQRFRSQEDQTAVTEIKMHWRVSKAKDFKSGNLILQKGGNMKPLVDKHTLSHREHPALQKCQGDTQDTQATAAQRGKAAAAG